MNTKQAFIALAALASFGLAGQAAAQSQVVCAMSIGEPSADAAVAAEGSHDAVALEEIAAAGTDLPVVNVVSPTEQPLPSIALNPSAPDPNAAMLEAMTRDADTALFNEPGGLALANLQATQE